VCYDDLSCSECIGLNNIAGIRARYAGPDLNCTQVDCTLDVFVGACCDGLGNCTVTTPANCASYGGFYHGNFSKCIDENSNSICAGATGACCVDGTCSELTFENCLNSNGIFAGYNKNCSNVVCEEQNICSSKSSRRLLPGYEYGGGIVVGKFIPGESEILGCSKLFSYDNYEFTKTTSFKPALYTAETEPEAGSTDESCYTENDGYLVIVYPYDLTSDQYNEIKNPFTQSFTKNQYHWGLKGYYAWGPLTNLGVYSDIENNGSNYYDRVVAYGEGFWSRGVTGITQGENSDLINNTFTNCSRTIPYGVDAESKLFSKSHYGLHGNWFRSYGLYNTIRAVSSLKATALGITGYMPQTYDLFYMVQKLDSGITSASQGITANPVGLSDWFVPSHDELAFIAAKTLNTSAFNINSSLLEKGYQPIYGKYWTSTGTFDYSSTQGVYAGITSPAPGYLAMSIEIPENGEIDYYNVYKSDRQQQNKVRPIRIIRCDEAYPASSKIWNLPKL
jgi:hypothetical protein